MDGVIAAGTESGKVERRCIRCGAPATKTFSWITNGRWTDHPTCDACDKGAEARQDTTKPFYSTARWQAAWDWLNRKPNDNGIVVPPISAGNGPVEPPKPVEVPRWRIVVRPDRAMVIQRLRPDGSVEDEAVLEDNGKTVVADCEWITITEPMPARETDRPADGRRG